MTFKRLLTQFRLMCYLGNGYKRADYAKKKDLYGYIGQRCRIPMSLPLYPKLVRLHNNVIMHRSVKLVTHDDINGFLMKSSDEYSFKNQETLCPIEIYDNVYIGMNTIILGNVRIGPNVIINAGSVITNDIPPNSIVGGVPAKVLGPLDKYAKLRLMKDKGAFEFRRSGAEAIDDRTVEMAWNRFNSKQGKK